MSKANDKPAKTDKTTKITTNATPSPSLSTRRGQKQLCDITYSTIAELTGLSVKTVRTYANRGQLDTSSLDSILQWVNNRRRKRGQTIIGSDSHEKKGQSTADKKRRKNNKSTRKDDKGTNKVGKRKQDQSGVTIYASADGLPHETAARVREVPKRLQAEGRWWKGQAGDRRNQLLREHKGRFPDKKSLQHWVYGELHRLYPPLPATKTIDASVSPVSDVDPQSLIDPDYTETDSAKRLRDAYLWVGDQFPLVVRDGGPAGTTIDFSRATTKPPTVHAIQIVETWGRRPPDKRDGLLRQIATYAAQAQAAAPEGGGGAEDGSAAERPPGGFLHTLTGK